ncbi:MAG: universal stress protein [Deltaproteobacteria bacterium]|nr:universal stress protein [Deltaproteobacteria bacterium]
MEEKIENIICTTDFSDSANHTIPYGIALAREFDAKLYLCHVIDLTTASRYGEAVVALEELKQQMRGYAHEQLHRLMQDQTVTWEPLIGIGNAADEIARLAVSKNTDIIISATHGRSGLKRSILGSVTARLMREVTCPLLVVRSPEHDFVQSADSKVMLNKILVGCDFSSDSLLALQKGFDLARRFHSVLHLVHVIEPPIYNQLLQSTLESEQTTQQELKSRLLQQLMGLATAHPVTLSTVRPALLIGKPHEELTKYAVLHNIDLIILGIRGHDLVGSLLAGSTTDRLMRLAACPVLLVYSTP